MKNLIIILVTLFLGVNVFGKEIVKETTSKLNDNISSLEKENTFLSIEDSSIPKYFQVRQNYPNPFNATTTIEYDSFERANTSIKIYNTIGELIITLENSIKEAGSYRIEWDGRNSTRNVVASGLYFYVVVANDYYSIKKMILLK